MSNAEKLRKQCNIALRPLNGYFDEIPLDAIFYAVKDKIGQVVQEDGKPWEGFLCGETGSTFFDIAGFRWGKLRLTWYKMPSGRYEIVTYIS
jgi:hypothetical protein